jgi:hypothetical protein
MELVFGSQLVTIWEEYRGYGHGYKWFREKVTEVIGMEVEVGGGDTPTPIMEEGDAGKVGGVEEDQEDGGEDEEVEDEDEVEEDDQPGAMQRASEHGDRHDRHKASEHGDRHDRHKASEHGDRHDRHKAYEHGDRQVDHGRADEIEDDRIYTDQIHEVERAEQDQEADRLAQRHSGEKSRRDEEHEERAHARRLLQKGEDDARRQQEEEQLSSRKKVELENKESHKRDFRRREAREQALSDK